MIRHLRHEEIGKERWDRWLLACPDRLWYACSHVLDAVSPGWEALVDEDSGAIMPLTMHRKWGFDYLYQPFGVQCLGVFAPGPPRAAEGFAKALSPERTGAFLAAVPERIRLWDIHLHDKASRGHPAHVVLRERTNMEIDLAGGPEQVRAAYSQHHRRGLRKWAGHGRVEPMDAGEFLRALTTSEQFRRWRPGERQRKGFERLVHAAVERGEGRAIGIRQEDGWAAAGLLVRWEGRSYFVKGVAMGKGQGTFALHRLLDAMIAEEAKTGGTFDLAGGEAAGMRRFYAGFGARPVLYLHALVNRLPQPLRWYKQRSDGA